MRLRLNCIRRPMEMKRTIMRRMNMEKKEEINTNKIRNDLL